MPPPTSSERMLAAVLFTDMVGSTSVAEKLGDRRWKALLDRHNALIRRELKRFGGRELDTAGDGFFASFREPASAIACACAAADAVRELGIEIRSGVHFGECEPAGRKLAGITVVVGARIVGLGGPGDVLVSGTAAELSRGAGFGFEDRGVHTLKGVEGEWRLVAATSVDGHPRDGPLADDEARGRLESVMATGGGAGPRRRPRLRQPRPPVGAAIGLIIANALNGSPVTIVPGPDSVARIDPAGEAFDRLIRLGDGAAPGDIAFGAGKVWVTTVGTRTLLSLESTSDAVQPFGTPSTPTGVAFAAGRVWLTFGFNSDELRRVEVLDPSDPVLQTAPLSVPDGSYPIAVGGGGIWIADPLGSTVTGYDPVTLETRSIDLPEGSGPIDLAVWDAGPSPIVWVAAGREPSVFRLDPSSPGSPVESFGTGRDVPTAIAVAADGTVWIVSEQSDSILAIGPDGTTKVHEDLGARCDGPTDVATTGDRVWVSCSRSRSVVWVRPSNGSTSIVLPVGGVPVATSVDGQGSVWVAVQGP